MKNKTRKHKNNKKTKKINIWKNWKQFTPNKTQRKKMYKRCGKKCFLGKNLSFPVCKKNTCKIKRSFAPYIRSKHWYNVKKKIIIKNFQ